jgi:hypothetical protein
VLARFVGRVIGVSSELRLAVRKNAPTAIKAIREPRIHALKLGNLFFVVSSVHNLTSWQSQTPFPLKLFQLFGRRNGLRHLGPGRSVEGRKKTLSTGANM